MPTVAFRTLGCKQNQFDTQALRRHLEDCGLRLESRYEEADWIILNTCAVTERALAKARGEARRMRRLNPQARIFALGCGVRYAAQTFIAEGCVISGNQALAALGLIDLGLELTTPHGFIPKNKTRALLRIQTGCTETCAYCIVPSLRGSSRSVPLKDCLQTAVDLTAQGAPEIILTGTNIALWGRDLPEQPRLQDLLSALTNQSGIARVRLSSLEPHLIEPGFLEWCLAQSGVCRHFHFAFQSGSPRILNAMKRREPAPQLIDYLRELTRQDPSVCLGADIMAGLPGETERDFLDSTEWIKSIPLSYLHVFPFSERIGTPAAAQNDLVPVRVRLERAAGLRRLNNDLKKRFIQSNHNHVGDVIILKNIKPFQGLTSNYLRITFSNNFTTEASRFAIPMTDDNISSIQIQK
jgi:threonylcarbamoyladenosine tRNA methylthiotransferase MtaB